MSRGKHMTPQKEADMVRYLTEYGYQIREICEEFMVSASTVYKVMRKHNVETPHTSAIDRLSASELDTMVKMYEDGKLMREIETTFDLSLSVIRNILFSKLGVVPHTARKDFVLKERARLEEAMELYKEGWVLWFINDRTGVSRDKITREASRRGWDRGRDIKGMKPAVDSTTRRYLMDDEGHYISQKQMRQLESVVATHKMTVDEAKAWDLVKGLGGLADG